MKGVAPHAKHEWFFILRDITDKRERAWYFKDFGTEKS